MPSRTKKSPLVSIIIVNWNGGKVFKRCLDSLAKIDYPRWELIVVDNGSSDGSVEFLKSRVLKLIENETNLGFAKANNQGYQKAKGKYILLLNNDTKVMPDFLSKLVAPMEEDTSIGVIQPKIFLMGKPKHLDNAGAFLTRTGFLQHWGFMQKDSLEFGQEREIFSAKGACMLVRRKVIEKVGLFDEDFVSYFEESDFCWRVWLAGWKVVFYPQAKIYHQVGFTSKKISPIKIHYHSFKNRIHSLFKNLSLVNLFSVLGCHLILVLALSFYYLAHRQFNKAKIIFLAIFWNIVNLRKAVAKRREVQGIRVKTDKELFETILHQVNFWEMLSHFKKVEASFK